MSVVTQYVINTVMEDHHPALNSDNCINKTQKRYPCTICKDICPNDVFRQIKGEPPQWGQCTACNLCVTACPARSLTASTDTLKPYLSGYDESGLVKLGCHLASQKVKLQEFCIASIPWEFIAYLALRMKVTLYMPCADCDSSQARSMIDEHMENLQHFLGDRLYKSHIRVVSSAEEDSSEDDDRGMTRNELFSLWKSQLLTSAFKSVAEVNVEDYNGLYYRRLLGDYTKKLSDSAKAEGKRTVFSVKLPHFNSKCYTCDVCERLCPNQAISFSSEVKDGKRGIYLEPWKCTGCGLCQKMCRDSAIDDIRYMQVPHLKKLLLTKVEARLCTECGRPLRHNHPDEICTFCKTKKRMDERKAKEAEKLAAKAQQNREAEKPADSSSETD